MTTTAKPATNRTGSGGRSPLYSIVIGLAALAILLQGLWAGLFLRNGGTERGDWVTVHARGGEIAILLTLASAVVAFLTLRERRDLWLGSVALAVVLAVEAYIGGEIKSTGDLTVVHVPLAMAAMSLAVWLPLRARAGRAAT